MKTCEESTRALMDYHRGQGILVMVAAAISFRFRLVDSA